MKTIRVAYENMWGRSKDFPANYLLELFPILRGHYDFVDSTGRTPQLAFYSVYGHVTQRHEGSIRLIYSGEAGAPFAYGACFSPGQYEPGFFQFGITCEESDSPCHRYMPQGLLHLNLYNQGVETLLRSARPNSRKEFFCNFIYSNASSPDRIEFFKKLTRYKPVESCGHILRNNDALAQSAYCKEGYLLKQNFQARCKFSISMENSYTALYTTEKLTDPLVAGSVPIYAGALRVAEFFNPLAFINLADFQDYDAAIDYIRQVDNDDALYQSYLEAPPFVGNAVPACLSDAHYLDFWRQILDPL
jgi:hypothetical protein